LTASRPTSSASSRAASTIAWRSSLAICEVYGVHSLVYAVYKEEFWMVATLAHERYISLTTFKRDGTPVSTPVWVVSDDGRRLLVWSGKRTWKVRRLRRNPQVFVSPANFRGIERGSRVAGRAKVVDDPGLDELLEHKYGWQKRFVDLLNRKSRAAGAVAAIEIVDAQRRSSRTITRLRASRTRPSPRRGRARPCRAPRPAGAG